jgi:hypothetical protein
MKFRLLYLLLGYLPLLVNLHGGSPIQLKWEIIPDSNYNIDQLTVLRWNVLEKNDTIFPTMHQKYWAKVTVNNPSKESFYLSVRPSIHNEWFYQSKGGHWNKIKSGILVASETIILNLHLLLATTLSTMC